MWILRIAGAVALSSVLATAPARAAEPMQPSGKWNVDFGDAHCAATRTYGPPDSPVTLAFKSAPIGDVMQVTVVRSSRRAEMNQYAGTLTVDRSSPVAISFLGHAAEDGKLRVTSAKLTPDNFALVRNASVLRLRAPGEIDTTFALSTISKVADTLDRCAANLRQAWHVGEYAAKLRQAPVALQPLQKLFSSEDYPRVALRNDGTGVVEAMLLVNDAGRIASCAVTETSGHASLDAQTCIILARRGRFAPAIGADGKPANSSTRARIRWKK